MTQEDWQVEGAHPAGMKQRMILQLIGATLVGALATAAPARTLAQYPPMRINMMGDAVARNLETFDDLDYDVFSGQKWAELHRSHSHDVTVHWPDGHATTGIEKHVEDLAAMFVYAPDTRIKVHTVKLGQKDWTSVIGVMEGTFTRPMPIGDGKFIEPTGKAYRITMATIAHWNKEGVMDEEYLFWDNDTFMKQIGLAK
jgi:hypothetical protein